MSVERYRYLSRLLDRWLAVSLVLFTLAVVVFSWLSPPVKAADTADTIRRAIQLDMNSSKINDLNEELKVMRKWQTDVAEARISALEHQVEKFQIALDMFKFFNTGLAIPVLLLGLKHFLDNKRPKP